MCTAGLMARRVHYQQLHPETNGSLRAAALPECQRQITRPVRQPESSEITLSFMCKYQAEKIRGTGTNVQPILRAYEWCPLSYLQGNLLAEILRLYNKLLSRDS